MGYYTKLEMSLRCAKDNGSLTEELTDKIREAFDKMLDYEGAFDHIINGHATWEWNWYSYEKEIEVFSKQFPEVIFTIEGKGEDREDWWIIECWVGCALRHDAVISPPDDYFNWEDFS